MKRIFVGCILAILLIGCGGPSESDIQATVQAAVESTAQAQAVAVSVKATQEAADVCGAPALGVYADSMDEELTTFEMQTSVAGSSPRMSMGVALQKLLDIQTETRRIKAPDCLKAYHSRVISAMGLYRYAYENFAAQGNESMTTTALQMGQTELAAVKKDIPTIRSGQVPIVPTPLVTPVPESVSN